MNHNPTTYSEATLYPARVPWATFIFLAIIFFVAQQNLTISLMASTGFQHLAELSAEASAQGNLGRRIVFSMLGLFGVISLMRKPRNAFKINGSLGWLILFFLTWSILSITWADDIGITFRRLVLFIMFYLGILAVYKRFSLRDIIWFTLFSSSLYLVIGLSTELMLGTFLPLEPGYRFTGTLHPNQQGINCALLMVSGIASGQIAKRGRKFFFTCAIIGLFFLILTRSRAPFASVILALFFVHWRLLFSKTRKYALILGGCFTFCLLILLVGDKLFPSIHQVVLLGRTDPQNVSTLTDRIPKFKDCLEYVKKRPFVGYGYNGFWNERRILLLQTEPGRGASDATSAYLELLLTLGIVGMAVCVLILIVGIRRSFIYYKASFNSGYTFFGVLLVFCLLDGLLESIFAEPAFITFLMWLALMCLAFKRPYTYQCKINAKTVEHNNK